MLTRAALRFINHLLTDETWARQRLTAFAGQTAAVSFGALTVPIRVTDSGHFEADSSASMPTVTIQLPRDAPFRVLADRPSLFAAAHLTGSAEFAETIGFVVRNLRWDLENDLSQHVGDIAAHRLLQGGKRFAQWHAQRIAHLAANVSEYLTEESSTIARRKDITDFCAAVQSLNEDCSRLEQRVQRLQQR